LLEHDLGERGEDSRNTWQRRRHVHGKPAVLLHGGPGSGSSPRHRQLFDAARYRIVQFDQGVFVVPRNKPGLVFPTGPNSTG
jgi:proline iminopeptidase